MLFASRMRDARGLRRWGLCENKTGEFEVLCKLTQAEFGAESDGIDERRKRRS